jgi:hypothetical protein
MRENYPWNESSDTPTPRPKKKDDDSNDAFDAVCNQLIKSAWNV